MLNSILPTQGISYFNSRTPLKSAMADARGPLMLAIFQFTHSFRECDSGTHGVDNTHKYFNSRTPLDSAIPRYSISDASLTISSETIQYITIN